MPLLKYIFLKSFLLLLLFFAAATLTASAVPENPCDWRNGRIVAPGIKLKHFDLKNPRPLNIHAVRVDLKHPRIYLINTGRDKDWGKPMPDYPAMKIETRRTRTGDFILQQRAAGHDVRLAVNATPWGPWCKPFNHKYAGNIGLVISEGVPASVSQKKSVPAFIVRKNGKPEMIDYKPGSRIDDIRLALSGFRFVLRNNTVVPNKSKTLHPRTFYGLSAGKRYLYFLIVDGRQKDFSEGFTEFEGGEFLKYLGAADGINMDGGGSTTLATCRNGKVRIVNTPPGALKVKEINKINYTRLVATSLGVCLKKPRDITVRRE